MTQKYCIVSDDKSRDYIVPSNRRGEWYESLFKVAPYPEWGIRIDNIRIDDALEFENPTLNGTELFPEIKTVWYCVTVEREFDGPYIFHFPFTGDGEPAREYVEQLIFDEEINYKPLCEDFSFYQI